MNAQAQPTDVWSFDDGHPGATLTALIKWRDKSKTQTEARSDVLRVLDRSVSVNSENLRRAHDSVKDPDVSYTWPTQAKSDMMDFPTLPTSTEAAEVPDLVKLQEWEGYVTQIGDEEFQARVIDLTAGDDIAKEEASFLIEDLTEDDRKLLVIGGVFRWILGYQRFGKGPKQRVSQIVFRRIPAWTRRDEQRAERFADRMEQALEWS